MVKNDVGNTEGHSAQSVLQTWGDKVLLENSGVATSFTKGV